MRSSRESLRAESPTTRNKKKADRVGKCCQSDLAIQPEAARLGPADMSSPSLTAQGATLILRPVTDGKLGDHGRLKLTGSLVHHGIKSIACSLGFRDHQPRMRFVCHIDGNMSELNPTCVNVRQLITYT